MVPCFLPPSPLPSLAAAPSRSTSASRRPSRPHCSLSAPPPPLPPTPPHRSEEPEISPEPIGSAAALQAVLAVTPGLAILEVFSTHCRACAAMKRGVRRAAARHAHHARFLQLDSDDDPQLAQSLGVRAMPTFILYKDGRRVDHFASSSRDKLEMYIADNV